MGLLPIAILGGVLAAPQTIVWRPHVDFVSTGTTYANYSDLQPSAPFTTVIVSWNVKNAARAALRVEARGKDAGGPTAWYRIADWSLDGKSAPRQSQRGQRDQDGEVQTDTIVFARPMTAVDLQFTLQTLPALSDSGGPLPQLDLVAVNFSNGAARPNDAPRRSAAWGRVIDVPQRAQGNYLNGGVLCSATCTSMFLEHYSQVFNRPEMDRDVPDVVTGVWDPVYDGAGNWPFNTAFMGSFAGLSAYVARLNSISDLEPWIEAGYPIATSVSLDLLMGRDKDSNSGHLVILLGFDEHGNPVFNDPAHRDQVRKTYRREDFERAWLNSDRTVYVVLPEGVKAPRL